MVSYSSLSNRQIEVPPKEINASLATSSTSGMQSFQFDDGLEFRYPFVGFDRLLSTRTVSALEVIK